MNTFEVVGNHTVDGVEPGGTVRVVDEERSRRLVRGGHLTSAKPAKKAAKKTAKKKAD